MKKFLSITMFFLSVFSAQAAHESDPTNTARLETLKAGIPTVVKNIAWFEGLTEEEQTDLTRRLHEGLQDDIKEDFYSGPYRILCILQPFIRTKDNPYLTPDLHHLLRSLVQHDNEIERVQFLVDQLGADINSARALHEAIKSQWQSTPNVLAFLLERGDLEQHDMFGRTPLGTVAECALHFDSFNQPHLADLHYERQLQKTKEKIELLLEAGANFNSVNREGHNFLQAMKAELDKFRDCQDGDARWRERAVTEIENMGAVQEKAAQCGMRMVAPFFHEVPGMASLVQDYLQSESLMHHREQQRVARRREQALQQAPYLEDIVGDYLPWELEGEDVLEQENLEQENKSDDI